MIHLPIKFKKGKFIYNLIKIYDGGFGLYENDKTGTKECFTPYQISALEEKKNKKEIMKPIKIHLLNVV